jgi:hypothetical protein
MNDTSNALLTGQISGALRLDSPLMTPTEAPASLFPGPSTTLAKGKRAREEDEAKVEAWTDEDIELVRAVSRPTTGEVVSNLEPKGKSTEN